MSRSWLGRPTGRHAAGARERAGQTGPSTSPSPATGDGARGEGAPGDGARLLGAPAAADAAPASVSVAPLVSPVTDEARAAAAGISPPGYVPSGAAPLVTIDALGRKCPIPIIMLAAQIRDVPVGSVIAVLADDPAAYSDIPAWCRLKSHDCVFRTDYATGWSFGIRRLY